MIALIDYDAGNIMSVVKAIEYLGEEAVLTRDRDTLLAADHVILPGVGSFGQAMDNLKHYELDGVIKEVAAQGTPFLGICLGLQLLFDESEESPGVSGLGLCRGKILRFPDSEKEKIPQMGWNSLSLQNNGRLFAGIPDQSYVYFVHSYYLKAEERSISRAKCQYIVPFDASIESGNLFACQFHPEKSGKVGLSILKNFLSL